MGTCRLGVSPEAGPLRESGEAWECDGLFVADGSTLPTSIGINPMITIEAVAYMVAEQVSLSSWACVPSSRVIPRSGSKGSGGGAWCEYEAGRSVPDHDQAGHVQ